MKLIIDTTLINAVNINTHHHTTANPIAEAISRKGFSDIVERISISTEDIEEAVVAETVLRYVAGVDAPLTGEHIFTQKTVSVNEIDEIFRCTVVITENSTLVLIQSTNSHNEGEWPYSAIAFQGSRGRFSEIFNSTSVSNKVLRRTHVHEYLSDAPDNMLWWETRKEYVTRAGGGGVNYPLRDIFKEVVMSDIDDNGMPTATHRHFVDELDESDREEFMTLCHDMAVLIDRISTVNKRAENRPL